jgi:hypothetical protein
MNYQNPFNQTLDWALQGKYVRLTADGVKYEGWVERVHHGRGSVVLHSVTKLATGENLGSLFVRNPGVVEVIKPRRRIEYRRLEELSEHPDHEGDYTPDEQVIRRCWRNQYAGSFPVVREDGTILNGHKRVAAARVAGLDSHAVEVVSVSDEVADELLALAHPEHASGDDDEDGGDADGDVSEE